MLPSDHPDIVQDIIRVEDEFYILAASSLADDRTRVLKQGETFAVFDRYGDVQPVGLGEQGVYHAGTRFLSRFELRLNETRPLLLSSTIHEENVLLTVDLTNPDLSHNGRAFVPRDTLHIFRSTFLWQERCYIRFLLRNYALEPLDIPFAVRFDADFADIFEVRGTKRPHRGRYLPAHVQVNGVVLGYEGLDGVTRRTRLECDPEPQHCSAAELVFAARLQPQESTSFFLTVTCEVVTPLLPRPTYGPALAEAEQALECLKTYDCAITTTNTQFNDWVQRAQADLRMMITETPTGLYPYAGVPWFSTPFGRDGLITALAYLWVNPKLARGVLVYLADMQAQEVSPEQDAEPGKILHEARQGEMAACGEIPFGRYYGSVDATPLFIILAEAYYECTGDRAFIETLWPHLEQALGWLDVYGDLDGDGFVEYARHGAHGLVNQGWKDSHDAVFHADGTLAEGPIALCEVQGYTYAAKRSAAALATLLGNRVRAAELTQQAQILQERFENTFWCDDLGTYALALDGRKRPCRVRTSNAGHVLFSGIAHPERAQRVAETLFMPESFSGWGIRTLAASERRYNPMAYHNGSIWPHDNAIIAAGLARYGFKDLVLQVLTGFFEASLYLDLNRLPELFCGFTRRSGAGPTLYPVACAPQAWASASVFLLLQACLGLSFQHPTQHPSPQLHFSSPLLPSYIDEVRLSNLRIGEAYVDLALQRYPQDVGIQVLGRQGGEVDISIVKKRTISPAFDAAI